MNAQAKILIVDDEPVVRLGYQRVLESVTTEVEAVGDGEEALRSMESQPSDLVFLDLHMPGMDGMEVLKRIKDRWPECEVVVITGYPTLESAKEAVRLDAFDYLAKPVGPDDVFKAANDAMTHKRWAIHKDREFCATEFGPRASRAVVAAAAN